MSKQTAVEWLIQRLHNRRKGIFDGLPVLDEQQLCEIAIIMEREQILLAYDEGDSAIIYQPQQYYEQIYRKEAGHE